MSFNLCRNTTYLFQIIASQLSKVKENMLNDVSISIQE